MEPVPGEGASLPHLDDALPMLLLRARDAVIALFRPTFQAVEVTEQQWRVLRALVDAGHPLTVGQLAEATSLLGPSIARILPGLEARGFITRRPHPDDARSVDCAIDVAGRELVERVTPELQAAYRAIVEHLGPADACTLEQLLGRLAGLADTEHRHRHRAGAETT